ncbi:MAG: hypothetical protein JWN34_4323 [Bryobacterales bacterium]|nr:hypothetical protein [Bryobacterales bacterium]
MNENQNIARTSRRSLLKTTGALLASMSAADNLTAAPGRVRRASSMWVATARVSTRAS